MSAKNPRKRPGKSGRPARKPRAGASRARPASDSGPAAAVSRVEPGERINRLEEFATFNDRAVEELTRQMLDLDRRLRQLMSRLESLESGLRAQTPPSPPREDDGRERLPDPPE